MSVNEWIAIGGLALSVLALLLDILRRSRAQAIKDAEREQKQFDQHNEVLEELKRVTKRLDEHNGYAEKFAQNAIAMTSMSKDIEYIKEELKRR